MGWLSWAVGSRRPWVGFRGASRRDAITNCHTHRATVINNAALSCGGCTPRPTANGSKKQGNRKGNVLPRSRTMRRHPIQRVHFCPATSHLYTAASNVLYVFDASASVAAGTLLSSWTALQSAVAAAAEDDDTTPRRKKRKVEQKQQQQQPRLGTASANNSISKILTTADGKYVIVATSEDKAVTVFAAPGGGGGELKALSARYGPSRAQTSMGIDQCAAQTPSETHRGSCAGRQGLQDSVRRQVW